MSREVRRVPLTFDWPLNKTWQGYLLPERLRLPDCTDCPGDGRSPRARELHNQYWGYAPFHPRDNGSLPFTAAHAVVTAFATRNVDRDPSFYIGRWYRPDMPHADVERQAAINVEARRLCTLFNAAWQYHLNSDDVDALIAHDRLREFTHDFIPHVGWRPRDPMPRPSVEEVNADAITRFGGDTREGVLIRVRCEREGVSDVCATCGGKGYREAWEGHLAEYEAWEPTPPPTGDGWQLWETVTEGSPVGPVFGNADALAGWLTTPAGGAAVGFGSYSEPMTWEQAQGFVKAGSSLGSFVSVDGVMHSGAAYMGAQVAAQDQS